MKNSREIFPFCVDMIGPTGKYMRNPAQGNIQLLPNVLYSGGFVFTDPDH